ncbi:hypothetical protein CHARACLAT_018078 [Characodon lateralis]|uniref:Uncharacterized protein n=1 Tax=Characodon lateralis TaxID=208331 RepID=A0ABU7CYL2_9TELE|nr:hypothetical protein [Characodon lateralis]
MVAVSSPALDNPPWFWLFSLLTPADGEYFIEFTQESLPASLALPVRPQTSYIVLGESAHTARLPANLSLCGLLISPRTPNLHPQ